MRKGRITLGVGSSCELGIFSARDVQTPEITIETARVCLSIWIAIAAEYDAFVVRRERCKSIGDLAYLYRTLTAEGKLKKGRAIFKITLCDEKMLAIVIPIMDGIASGDNELRLPAFRRDDIGV